MSITAPVESVSPAVPVAAPAVRTRLERLRLALPEMLIFAAAAAARLTVILRHGSLHDYFGYDAAVYFGASDALVHGRMPYSGFIFLHPPGLAVALTPLTSLTYVTGDANAFAIANLFFALLGAANAVLVVRIARQLGLGRPAALAGGAFYALWFGAIGSEYLTKLEPFGNFLVLSALLLLAKAQSRDRTWYGVAAGIALGFAVSVKIWWIVPVVAIVGWHVWATRRRRAGLVVLGGAFGGALVLNLPFFLHAPRAMWNSVIVEQLQRHPNPNGPLPRLADLTTLPRLGTVVTQSEVIGFGIVFGALFALVLARALRHPVGRAAAALLGVQLGVVLLAPSWFPYYCDYVAAAAALVVAAGAAPRPAGQPRLRDLTRFGAWLPVAAAGTVTTLVLALGTSVVRPYLGADQLAVAVAKDRCVMSDAPLDQIELDALSRGLADGCQEWIDDTGPLYGRDKSSLPLRENARWQHDLTRYLRSGDAVIFGRMVGASPTRATRRAVERNGELASAGGHTVYRVTH